ncbi:MAG: hypothetical protein JF612_09510 [Planctomycetia bacterium]|nr:hypothetical protein [Planctomycetia bacterium]
MPVPVGWINRQSSKIVWDVLGVKGQSVSAQSPKTANFTSGLLIEDVSPGWAGDQLKVGDIIVGLHIWQTRNVAELAWTILQPIGKGLVIPNPQARQTPEKATLSIRRDGQPLRLEIELPPWPQVSLSIVSQNLSDSDTRAVRDKLRERWTQIDKLYEFGRVPVVETLQAAKEVNAAELAAASSATDRREALRGGLDRLKKIKSIVDSKVAAGAEPEVQKLTVDAEVLKAEGELAADGQQPSVSRRAAAPEDQQRTRASSLTPAAPSIVLSPGGQSITLHTPDDFRQQLLTGQGRLDRIKEDDISNFVGDSPDDRAKAKERQLKDAEQRLELARAEYAAQIRLLELEMKDAASAVQSAQKAEQLARSLRERNPAAVSLSQLNEAQRALEGAQLRLERANTLVELYRKADPKNADESSKPDAPATEGKQPQRRSRSSRPAISSD